MHGEIQLIVGSMFAGKSTELIRRLERYERAQRRVLAVKSALDQRYSAAPRIITHRQHEFGAVVARELSALDVAPYDVVGVDEGQFYADLAEACERWAAAGKTVIVAMLDGDARRQPFPGSQLAELLARAESVTKLLAVCQRCGADAAFSQLTSAHTQLDANHVKVGGAELYRAVCRQCHALGQAEQGADSADKS